MSRREHGAIATGEPCVKQRHDFKEALYLILIFILLLLFGLVGAIVRLSMYVCASTIQYKCAQWIKTSHNVQAVHKAPLSKYIRIDVNLIVIVLFLRVCCISRTYVVDVVCVRLTFSKFSYLYTRRRLFFSVDCYVGDRANW